MSSGTLILDSTFLVDLEREQRQLGDGSATRFLEAQGEELLAITFTIAGELAAGETLGRDRAAWARFLSPFYQIGFTDEVAWLFGRPYRHIRAKGQLIGANELWIAAASLAHEMPVVTRNTNEFRRVPGLVVLEY